MALVNLCPHPINVRLPSGETIEIPPSGIVARVASRPGAEDGDADGVPCFGVVSFGEVENLPEPQDGVTFIVSGLVAGRVSRRDVVSPGTGPNDKAIRKDGAIVAVTRFNRSC